MAEYKNSYEQRTAKLISKKVVGASLAATLAFSTSLPVQAFADTDPNVSAASPATGSGSTTTLEPRANDPAAQNGINMTVEEAQQAADKAQAELDQTEAEYNNAVADAAAKATELENAKAEKANAEQELAAAQQATPDASAEAVSKANAAKEEAEKAVNDSNAALKDAQDKFDAANKAYQEALGRQTEAQNALATAQAEFAAATTAVANAEAEVARTKVALDQAEQNSSASGTSELKAKLDAAQAALDASIEEKNRAAIQVEAAQTELDAANTELEACRAAQTSAQTQVDNANAALAASNEQLVKAQKETQNAEADLKAATDAENAAKATVATKQQALNDATDKVNAAEKNKADADALVTQKEQELANAQAAAANVEEIRAKGLVGMLEWMLTQGTLTQAQKNDILAAQKLLDDAMKEDFSQYPKAAGTNDLEPGRNNKVVAVGFERDAISLDNILKSLQVMRRINEVRAADNNFVGYNPAQVNFYFMSGAAAAANRGARLMTHSKFIGNCEGLAWGWSDPVVGWYDKEKVDFDKIRDELNYSAPVTWEQALEIQKVADKRTHSDGSPVQVGHYIFLFYAQDQVMGTGFNQYSGYGKTSEYCATAKGGTNAQVSYTVDEFESWVKRYKSSLDNANQVVEDAKAALDAAKAQQTNAANDVAAAKNEKESAAKTVEDAQAALDEATKAVTAAEGAKSQKQQAEADAQTKVAADQKALADAQKTLEEKAQAVINQQTVVKRVSEKLDSKKADLSEAEADVEKKRQARDKALDDLNGADQALAQARKAYADAQAALDASREAKDKALAAQIAATAETNNASTEVGSREKERTHAEEAYTNALLDNDMKNAEFALAAKEADRLTNGWNAIENATNRLNLADSGLQNAQAASDQAQAAVPPLSEKLSRARHARDASLANLALAQANQPKPAPTQASQSNPKPAPTQASLGSQQGSYGSSVAKTGNLAQTGDDNKAVGLGIMAALSSAVLAAFANMRRKKED